MKIKLFECLQVWNALVEIRDMNPPQVFSAKLSGNMSYLRPEIQKWNELSKAERVAFAKSEIELPLVEIVKKDLPPKMPKDQYENLNPIAKGTFKNQKSELEKLLEEKAESDKQETAEEG